MDPWIGSHVLGEHKRVYSNRLVSGEDLLDTTSGLHRFTMIHSDKAPEVSCRFYRKPIHWLWESSQRSKLFLVNDKLGTILANIKTGSIKDQQQILELLLQPTRPRAANMISCGGRMCCWSVRSSDSLSEATSAYQASTQRERQDRGLRDIPGMVNLYSLLWERVHLRLVDP